MFFNFFLQNETPLHWAARAGSLDAVKYLVSKGANINAQTSYFKETPLHLAIQENRPEVIQFLLENKADPNIRNYEGENTVFLAIRWSTPSVLQMLLRSEADPNFYNKDAKSPLHLCVDYESIDNARVLMMEGGDPNYQDSNGMTAFHIAVERGCVELAQLFAESGADSDIRDAQMRTVWSCNTNEFKTRAMPLNQELPPKKATPTGNGDQDSKQWLIDGKCYMCKTAQADRLLLPCKHKVICKKCAGDFFAKQMHCPQCMMAVFASVDA